LLFSAHESAGKMWTAVDAKARCKREFSDGMVSRNARFVMPARSTLNWMRVRRWSGVRGKVAREIVYAAGMWLGRRGCLGEGVVWLGSGMTVWRDSDQWGMGAGDVWEGARVVVRAWECCFRWPVWCSQKGLRGTY
jgi:hypothetical protein